MFNNGEEMTSEYESHPAFCEGSDGCPCEGCELSPMECKGLTLCVPWLRDERKQYREALQEAIDTLSSFDGLIGYGSDCDEKIQRWQTMIDTTPE